jgi:ribose/xylose/arabinose/galactoside ABC-type transport system permease subunit
MDNVILFIKDFYKDPKKRMTLALLGAFLLLCVYLTVTTAEFLTHTNIGTLLRQASMTGIIAVGMTMIIIAGEIDLSVGSLVAFSGTLMAYLAIKAGVPILPAIIITIICGMGIGAFTGSLKNQFRLPTFITTLALMTILRGVSFLITGGFSITPFPDSFEFLGGGYLFQIPAPVILMAVIFAVGHFIMTSTSFGRNIYAIGGNEEAARISGVKVKKVRLFAFMILGGLTALTGIILASRLMSGTPTVANGWEMDVIASVIIGGASLSGGAGSIMGTLLGVLFMGVLANGMVLLGVTPYMQMVVRGFVILLAVWFGFLQNGKNQS